MDVESLVLAQKYTDKSIEGISGALAGKNATIKSTAEVDEGIEVIFTCVADNGSSVDTTIVVPKGPKGDKGESGDKGDKGDKGDTGNKGDKGDKGDAGENGSDGENGNDGISVVSAKLNSLGKLVFVLSDGSETAPFSLPTAAVSISETLGNILVMKEDGAYVPPTDTSNFVEKITGKGLSSNDYSNDEKKQVADNKSAIDVLNGSTDVNGSVSKQINEALAKLNKLTKQEVSELPSLESADPNVIYLLTTDGKTKQYTTVTKNGVLAWYSEAMDVDLSDYLKKDTASETYIKSSDVEKNILKDISAVTDNGITYLTYKGNKILDVNQLNTVLNGYVTNDGLTTVLEGKIDKSNITKTVNITSTDTQVPSAKSVYTELTGKLDAFFGVKNAGKILFTDSLGQVTAEDADCLISQQLGNAITKKN